MAIIRLLLSFLHLFIPIPIPLCNNIVMTIVPSKKPLCKLILFLKSHTPHSTHYKLSLLCTFTTSPTLVNVHYTKNYNYNTSQFTSTFIRTRNLNSCSSNNSAFVISCVLMFCLFLMRLFTTIILQILPSYLFVFGCECRYLQPNAFYIVNKFLNSAISAIVLLPILVING